MSKTLKTSAQRVQETLKSFGIQIEVKEFSESTRTSQEAADTIGCSVGQIAKSLVFKGESSLKPYLIIASGANRVNEKTMKLIIGEKLKRSDPDFVLEHTGFAIGGIPPVGHIHPILTYIDEDLLHYDVIWAAAGTPHAVFELTPKLLVEITKGQVISIL